MLTKSKFQPAWWLRNPHAQTLWAAKVQPAAIPDSSIERITTPDNDFLDLQWGTGKKAPVVVIFHGLTGSANSRYVRSIINRLNKLDISAVLMHFRGCSGQPNLTAGSYHSGHTTDIEWVIKEVATRYPNKPIFALGYSLGANALLKYLATHKDIPLKFAIAVSPPLNLFEGAKRLDSGFSKLYQWVLLKQMKAALRHKDKLYPHLNLSTLNYEQVRNFVEFDHQITAKLHGYESSDDYYHRASTLDDLIDIQTPTHIIFARNDPFFTERCIPTSDRQLSASVVFEVADHAGHVAFISGGIPLLGRDWLCDRITALIRENCERH